MDEKELLLGLLTKTLNKSDEELAGLLYQNGDDGETLKEGAHEEALGLLEDKIAKIKDASAVDEKKIRDEGYGRAKKEVMGHFEAELKEKYGVDSDSTGGDLVEEIVSKFREDNSELTPDKIKITQTYRDREKELKKEMRDALKEKDTEIEGLKTGFEKQTVWSDISGRIRKKLHDKTPVMPKNQKAASNLEDLFINSFREFDWQKDDNGQPIALRDGKRVEDSLGNEVPFDSLVEGRIQEYFDLPTQESKGSPGNENRGSTGGTAFKDEKEYYNYVSNEPDPEKRVEARKIWVSQQK